MSRPGVSVQLIRAVEPTLNEEGGGVLVLGGWPGIGRAREGRGNRRIEGRGNRRIEGRPGE